MNKVYGTQILVTETIYQSVKSHFVLRKIDHLAAKGKEISYLIYELLAQNTNELNYDIDFYKDIFEKAFTLYSEAEWEEAILVFQKCLKVYPDDSVAPVFIERCRELIQHPPIQWDGVWRM